MRGALFLLMPLLVALGGSPAVAQDHQRATDALKRLGAPAGPDEEDSSDKRSDLEEQPPAIDVPMDGSPERVSPPAVNESGAERSVETITVAKNGDQVRAIVLPVTDAISKPNQFIIRRGLKEAISQEAEVIVLDIDSPGGRVDVMLEIMEQIDRFEGLTIAYVNDEALSAAALIASIADEIWYAPKSVIGSAGLVSGTGEEIPETMRQKVESYVRAKLRALSDPHPYREQVVRAMMDASYELEIDGKIISPEGEMLNLTAEEALQRYGEPPTRLFGEGMAENVASLLDQRFGEGNWEVRSFTVTWSEELAKYLNSIAPLLIGFGIVGLFIEFKTPGFGIFGILGITFLAVVFITNYIAGLAGWEPFIVLLFGLALIAVDLFLLPGTIIPMTLGGILVLGAILWSMTDIWPVVDGSGIDVRWESLYHASARLSLGILLGCALAAILWRLLPRTHLLDRLVLGGAAGLQGIPDRTVSEQVPPGEKDRWPQPGETGTVTRTLRPGGEVEIGGRRFEARVLVGTLPRGARVRVIRRAQFGLEVESHEGNDT